MRMRIEGIYSSRLTVYCDVVAGFASSHVTAPIPAPRNQQSKKGTEFQYNADQASGQERTVQRSRYPSDRCGTRACLLRQCRVGRLQTRAATSQCSSGRVSVHPSVTSPSNKRRNAFQRQQTHPQRVTAQQVLVKRRRGRSDLSRSPLERVAHE